jgi:eukaryotic-like serine/threonine-protein kinase
MNQSVLGDRYRVEARIGSGGMAEVYRGIDPVLNRTVAIKVLLPQFARDAGFVARFRREAQAAARLNHPNIVGVYDTGSDGDTQFIVMEFIEGRTLHGFLSSGKKPTPIQAVELAQRICAALGAAHAQGVIHRDIKPANVMVTRGGEVKVMDFGIARIETQETAPQTSAVLGTASYLSPEQAQGLPVDARTDIYSLGTVLYELLTGRPPFTGDSPVAIAYKQVNETPVPPSKVNADVPPRLDAVVMRALSKNPANRYQTAQEFFEDLERVKKGQEVQATPLMAAGAAGAATQVISRPQATQVLRPPEDPPGSGRKVWLGVLIGVLIVAVLGGGGYLLATSLVGDPGTTQVSVPNVKEMTEEEATAKLEEEGLKVGEITKEVTQDVKPGIVLGQDPFPDTLVDEGTAVNLTVSAKPKKVEVPNLIGMTLIEAGAKLEEVGLNLGTRSEAESDAVEVGQIFQQDPIPGSSVEKGSSVTVTTASGPATIELPDVTCLPYSAAREQLLARGFTNVVSGGTKTVLSQCPSTLNVVDQDPIPGSYPADTTITLYTGVKPSPTTPPPTTATPTSSPT